MSFEIVAQATGRIGHKSAEITACQFCKLFDFERGESVKCSSQLQRSVPKVVTLEIIA